MIRKSKWATWIRSTAASIRLESRPVGSKRLSLPLDLSGKRIALLKLDAIGDFILSTTLLRPMYERYPSGHFTLFCRSPAAELAQQQFPAWEVCELPPRRSPLCELYFTRKLHTMLKTRGAFDILIDLRSFRDMRDSVLSSWLSASIKMAMENQNELEWVRLDYDKRVYDILLPKPHLVKGVALDLLNYRSLAAALLPPLYPTGNLIPHLLVSGADRTAVRARLLKEFGIRFDFPFLLVSPGSLCSIKEYPPTALACVIRMIAEHTEMEVVVTGSTRDRSATRRVMDSLEGLSKIRDVTGVFSLSEHVALTREAAAVISMDSATAHIAGSLKTPAVVILGGGQFGIFGPWGQSKRFKWLTKPMECYGCHWFCVHHVARCIHEIPATEVATAIFDVISAAAMSES